jgi:hypothetical protein
VSRSQRPPEFFIDRSLGRHRMPQALRERGWWVRTQTFCCEAAGCPRSSTEQLVVGSPPIQEHAKPRCLGWEAEVGERALAVWVVAPCLPSDRPLCA